jgi:predicted transcriptional regulator
MDALFDVPTVVRSPEPVLMSLNPEYFGLMWRGEKTHEFRRRYPSNRPTTWFVYLTAPVSRLSAVIDLDMAIVDTPERIAAIAEQARPGNGASVFEYLKDLPHGYAMPIRSVREFEGFSAHELTAMLGSFHPPQGYTLIRKHPEWTAVCEKLAAGPLAREKTLAAPGRVSDPG